jgi:hypothetical protein
MSRIAFAALLLTLPLAAEERLTNNDIIQMVQAGVAEDLIVGTIKEAMPGYSFMPVYLVVLKKAGVSDEVVRAMSAPCRPHPRQPAHTEVRPARYSMRLTRRIPPHSSRAAKCRVPAVAR